MSDSIFQKIIQLIQNPYLQVKDYLIYMNNNDYNKLEEELNNYNLLNNELLLQKLQLFTIVIDQDLEDGLLGIK